MSTIEKQADRIIDALMEHPDLMDTVVGKLWNELPADYLREMLGLLDQEVTEALDIINRYGGIDGAHHKQWCLDQVVRILTRCPKVTRTTLDHKGRPYNYETLSESREYQDWVAAHEEGEDGPHTYPWDKGVAP